VDRGNRDAVCNGNVLLAEASQDSLPAKVFAPGLGFALKRWILGFSPSYGGAAKGNAAPQLRLPG